MDRWKHGNNTGLLIKISVHIISYIKANINLQITENFLMSQNKRFLILRILITIIIIYLFLYKSFENSLEMTSLSEIYLVLIVYPAYLLNLIINNSFFVDSSGGLLYLTNNGIILFYGLILFLSVFVPIIWDKYISKK
jgi:hypothetical protein